MYRFNIYIIVLIALVLLSGCSVSHYKMPSYDDYKNQDHYKVELGRLGVFAKDSGLDKVLTNLNFRSQAVKDSISEEIKRRKSALSKRKTWISVLGFLASSANAVYAISDDNPDKGLTAGLGIVSGSALFAALPFLSQDERLASLQTKLEVINNAEKLCMEGVREANNLLAEGNIIFKRMQIYESKHDASKPIEFPIPDDAEILELRKRKLELQIMIEDKIAQIRLSILNWNNTLSQENFES